MLPLSFSFILGYNSKKEKEKKDENENFTITQPDFKTKK